MSMVPQRLGRQTSLTDRRGAGISINRGMLLQLLREEANGSVTEAHRFSDLLLLIQRSLGGSSPVGLLDRVI